MLLPPTPALLLPCLSSTRPCPALPAAAVDKFEAVLEEEPEQCLAKYRWGVRRARGGWGAGGGAYGEEPEQSLAKCKGGAVVRHGS